MTSTRLKEYTALLQISFFQDLLFDHDPQSENAGDWLQYASSVFGISRENVMQHSRKTTVAGPDVKKLVNKWREFHNITEPNLVHCQLQEDETEEIRMQKVHGVLKAMKITYGDAKYNLARTYAMKSEFWPNRPHAGKVYSSADLATNAEIKDVLVYLLTMKNLLEYTTLANSADSLIWKREMLVPCVLHKVNRINSTIMVLLFDEIARLKGRKVSDKDKIVEECSQMANLIFSNVTVELVENLGEAAEKCNYKFLVKIEEGVFMPINISCVRSTKLINQAFAFINNIFKHVEDNATEMERKAQLEELVAKWIHIRENYLYCKKYLTDEQIQQFQDDADVMCEMFVYLFGKKKITPYLNDLFSGVDRLYLERYKSLYFFSNVGAEAFVGVLRSICDRRTNGGHTGVNGHGGFVETIQRWTSRRLGRAFDAIGYTNSVYDTECHQEDRFINECRIAYNESRRVPQAEKARRLSAAGQRRRHQQMETEADDFLDGITIQINAEEEPLADTNY